MGSALHPFSIFLSASRTAIPLFLLLPLNLFCFENSVAGERADQD
jgi:hypothetical protein